MQEKSITFKFDLGMRGIYGKLPDGTVFYNGGNVYIKISKKSGAKDLERPGLCWWPEESLNVGLRNF